MIVVGTVGLNGSGKYALFNRLHERNTIHELTVGDLVREVAAQSGEKHKKVGTQYDEKKGR
jgi:dephospho-CoA kinase